MAASEPTTPSSPITPSTPASPTPTSPAPSATPPSSSDKTFTSVKAVGVATERNAKYRRTMEDEHIVVDAFGGIESSGYFGVYDGHGGRMTVEIVKTHLHDYFRKCIQNSSVPLPAMDDEAIETAWKAAYSQMDSLIADEKIMYSGTTSATLLVRTDKDGKRWAHAANAGDSRIVLVRAGKGVRLTMDHKATEQSEIQRIQDAGGFILLNRVNGMLAVTRALGDLTMKEHVISVPYTSHSELNETDTHLIVACDGIWDVIEDDEAAQLVVESASAQEAAVKLMRQSLKKGSTDNISVMVIQL